MNCTIRAKAGASLPDVLNKIKERTTPLLTPEQRKQAADILARYIEPAVSINYTAHAYGLKHLFEAVAGYMTEADFIIILHALGCRLWERGGVVRFAWKWRLHGRERLEVDKRFKWPVERQRA